MRRGQSFPINRERAGTPVKQNRNARAAVVERLEGRRLLAFGDLDETFGTGGFVQTKFRDRPGGVQQLFTMSDGRIVAVGQPGIARYLPDGAPDTSFSGDGKVYANGGAIVAAQLDGADGSVVALQRVGEEDYV